MHRFSNVFVAFICFAFFGIPDAFAESAVHPFITSKFTVQAGLYYPTQDINLRVDGSLGGENIEFDFDEQLGFRQEDDVFTLEMTWRFGRKWSLRMQHFQENRRSSVVVETDIEWGDRVLTAGSSVTGGTGQKITRMFFGRAFDSSLQYDYGLGIGICQISVAGTTTRHPRNGTWVAGSTGFRCQSVITQGVL